MILITIKQHKSTSTCPHKQISFGSWCHPSNRRFGGNWGL